jgi:hypothetical protein
MRRLGIARNEDCLVIHAGHGRGGANQGQLLKEGEGMAVQRSMQHHTGCMQGRDVRGRDSGRASTRAIEGLGSTY